MTEPNEQFAELTRRGHQVFTAALRAWEDAARALTEALRRPRTGLPDVRTSVDAAFDFAAQMLADQREFTKTLMTAGPRLLGAAAQRTAPDVETSAAPDPAVQPAIEAPAPSAPSGNPSTYDTAGEPAGSSAPRTPAAKAAPAAKRAPAPRKATAAKRAPAATKALAAKKAPAAKKSSAAKKAPAGRKSTATRAPAAPDTSASATPAPTTGTPEPAGESTAPETTSGTTTPTSETPTPRKAADTTAQSATSNGSAGAPGDNA
jgi:hypothetical protein